MKRLLGVRGAAPVAVLVTLLTGLMTLPILPAAAATPRADETGVAAQPGINRLPSAGRRLAISVTRFSPRIVTDTAGSITVSGTLTNVGDRPISDVEARLQAGHPITSRNRLLEQLRTPTDPVHEVSPFRSVTRRLLPGQHTPFTITMRLAVLGLTERGVYPLQINVNGTPDYGGRARLVAVDLLIPVHPSGRTSEKGTRPAGVSVLWPLAADYPRLAGSADGQPILADDGLNRSVSPGGRLYGLVDAAKHALASAPKLASSLCFAIDPDLLDTVKAMTGDYRVVAGPDKTTPGHGQRAASAWLADLREATRGRCVMRLPYAGADLVALERAGLGQLAKEAVSSNVVHSILPDAAVTRSVLWPFGGVLDTRTADALAGDSALTVIADPRLLGGGSASGRVTIDGTRNAHALPVDPIASTALGGLPTHGQGGDGPAPGATAATSVPALASQNGIAALLFEATGSDRPSGTGLVAPAQRWQANEQAATAFLDTLHNLFSTGAADPRSLPSLLSAPAGSAPATLRYTPQAAADELPAAMMAQLSTDDATQRDLLDAMKTDTAHRLPPQQLLAPVRLGMVRASSTAFRTATPRQRQGALAAVSASLDAITSMVTVHGTNRPISMASNNTRLPISVSNGLPVDITVHIDFSKAAGLQTQAIPDPVIPARSGRTLYVPTKVLRSGWLSADISLTTPGGTPLGHTARLALRSSAYGSITLIVTGVAFGLLVLLVGLRIYRRVRSARTRKNRHTDAQRQHGPDGHAFDREAGVDETVQDVQQAQQWQRPGAHDARGGRQLGPSRDGR